MHIADCTEIQELWVLDSLIELSGILVDQTYQRFACHKVPSTSYLFVSLDSCYNVLLLFSLVSVGFLQLVDTDLMMQEWSHLT